MMVPLVPAFAAVGFCQFNPAIFNAIDGSDVHGIGANNLHMLFYRGLRHSSLLASGQQGGRVAISQSLLPNPVIGVGKCEHICTSLHSSPPGNIQAPIIKTLLGQLINMPAH
jgi:hypothetical protein